MALCIETYLKMRWTILNGVNASVFAYTDVAQTIHRFNAGIDPRWHFIGSMNAKSEYWHDTLPSTRVSGACDVCVKFTW